MSKPQHAAIAEQAYFLWLDDGMAHGKAEQHWALAEKLLAQQPATATAKKTRTKTTKPAPRAARIRKAEAVLHS